MGTRPRPKGARDMNHTLQKYWENRLYNKCVRDRDFLEAIAQWLERMEREECEKCGCRISGN